jgi:hypothetical protein
MVGGGGLVGDLAGIVEGDVLGEFTAAVVVN